MECVGQTSLELELGGMKRMQRFKVVNNLNGCDGILGVRSMKAMGMELNFSSNKVQVNGISLPLQANIATATTLLGNWCVLNL